MLSKSLSIASCVIVLALVSGCANTTKDPVYSELYQYDRTLSLKDIAPVIPAYIERPYPLCELEALFASDNVHAKIDGEKAKRVYIVEGVKCVASL